MLKQIAWNTFKKTGNINTFIELSKMNEVERNIYDKAIERNINGNENGNKNSLDNIESIGKNVNEDSDVNKNRNERNVNLFE